jgi:hypothetical protein
MQVRRPTIQEQPQRNKKTSGNSWPQSFFWRDVAICIKAVILVLPKEDKVAKHRCEATSEDSNEGKSCLARGEVVGVRLEHIWVRLEHAEEDGKDKGDVQVQYEHDRLLEVQNQSLDEEYADGSP